MKQPAEMCQCDDPTSTGFIKDATCNESSVTVAIYAIIIVLSAACALVGIDAIVKFCRRPPTSGKNFTILLFFVFQFTLWSNVLFGLDIAFAYGEFLYFFFYFMTQMFYFSIIAYLYSWVRILVKSYQGNMSCKVESVRFVLGGFFIILTLLFLFGLIYSYVINSDEAVGPNPRHHPFHVPSAILSGVMLIGFTAVGIWLLVRFKSHFKNAFNANFTASSIGLVCTSGICFLYPLVYQIWSAVNPQYLYLLRKQNCLGQSVSWPLLQLFLYISRIIPILLFHVFLIARYYQTSRRFKEYGRNSSDSIVFMNPEEIFIPSSEMIEEKYNSRFDGGVNSYKTGTANETYHVLDDYSSSDHTDQQINKKGGFF